MLKSMPFIRKTRQDKALKVAKEHYLRDDIYRGAPSCKVCDTLDARLSSSTASILVLDTIVVLQIDLLENSAIDDVVILPVVLDDVNDVYNIIRALCSNHARKIFVFSNEYHK